jgi:hypothetical protein
VAGWISQEAASDTETNVWLCRVLLGNGGDKTESNLSQEKNIPQKQSPATSVDITGKSRRLLYDSRLGREKCRGLRQAPAIRGVDLHLRSSLTLSFFKRRGKVFHRDILSSTGIFVKTPTARSFLPNATSNQTCP